MKGSNSHIILLVISTIAILALVVVGGIIYRFIVEGQANEALVNGVFALAGTLIGHLSSVLSRTVATPAETKKIEGQITTESPTDKE